MTLKAPSAAATLPAASSALMLYELPSASAPTGDRLRAQHTSPRQWLRLYSTGQPGK